MIMHELSKGRGVRFLAFILSVLLASMARAEVPIDLDSPFSKVAVIQNTMGQRELREVVGGEKKGKLIELRKADGSLIIVPEENVVAIVPKLPTAGLKYTRDEASRAYVFLQKAQSQLSGIEEVSPTVLKAWGRLASQESNYEAEAKRAKSAMIQNWFSKVSLEGDQEKNVSLEEYVREGEAFLGQAGDEKGAILLRLEKARQRMAMDFSKIERIQLLPEWENVTPALPLGIIIILGLLTIWGFLNISNFLTAVKMMIMNLLSSERSSRSLVVSLKSLSGIILGPLLFYVVYLATRVEKIPPAKDTGVLSQAGRRALYLSLNSHFNWSNQAPQRVEVSADEMLGFLFGRVKNTDSSAGGYLQYALPVYSIHAEGISWIQSLKLLWLPLQITFVLPTGEGLFSFENAKLSSCAIGKIQLGAFLGEHIATELLPAFKEFDQLLGINSRAEWKWRDKNTLWISTPEVVLKKAGDGISEGPNKRKYEFKKQISAAELATVFAEGSGSGFLGQYVDVSGRIVEVASSHRLGNSVVTETIRKTLANQGGLEAVAKLAPKGVEDTPDLFYLSTEGGQPTSKIRVKCVVKAPETFYMDGHGDLYREGQNPGTDDPLVRKGKEAHFNGGRIESFDRGVIELYDAKLVEAGGNSLPAGETKTSETRLENSKSSDSP